jgi:hypothetical protein
MERQSDRRSEKILSLDIRHFVYNIQLLLRVWSGIKAFFYVTDGKKNYDLIIFECYVYKLSIVCSIITISSIPVDVIPILPLDRYLHHFVAGT